MGTYSSLSAEERFWLKVDRACTLISSAHVSTPCWEWVPARRGDGKEYGFYDGIPGSRLVHRISWILESGHPGAMMVLHRCDNRICVRPDHLFLGTHADNMEDMRNKGRQATGKSNGSVLHPDRLSRGNDHYSKTRPHVVARGEKASLAKLTDSMVIDIRSAASSGEAIRAIARRVGVDPSTIRDAVRRRTWTHV